MKSKSLSLHQLSRRERQILDVIYAQKQATVAEIQDRIPDAPSYSTVRALLRIMVDKGYLLHQQEGNRYVYSLALKRQSVEKSALRQMLQSFFGGSVEKAVVALLSSPDTKLSPEELDRLSNLIEEAREHSDKNASGDKGVSVKEEHP
jgi:predicted transcriptional regulator